MLKILTPNGGLEPTTLRQRFKQLKGMSCSLQERTIFAPSFFGSFFSGM